MGWIWLILILCYVTSSLANDTIFSIINSGNPCIVGGSNATLGEIPYQGFLIISVSSSPNIHCGCSLISPEWAVTAAHCTYKTIASQITATFGTIYFTSSASDFDSRQEINVADVYVHQKYNDATEENDISLLRLSTPVVISDYATPISLPQAGDSLVEIMESLCVISGWGKTTECGKPSEVLQRADIPLIDNARCQEMITEISSGTTIIHKEQVCAGCEQGGTDSCQGDSGGPLACRSTTSNEPILIGITSFGFGCAQPQSPGVYTRVSSYREWIDDVMKSDEIPNRTTRSTPFSSTTSGAESSFIFPSRKMFVIALLVFYAI